MKAKLIYEKFKEDADPIEDLGVGIYYFDVEYYTTENLKEELEKDASEHELKLKVVSERYPYIKFRFIGTKNNLIKYLNTQFYRTPDYIEKTAKKIKKLTENIDEKFKEDSDPIQDLGIGLKKKIEKWLDTIGWETAALDFADNVLRAAAYFNEKQYLLYAINNGADIHHDNERALRNAMFKRNFEIAKILIKHGANFEKAFNYALDNGHERTTDSFLIFKKRLNEKFEEVSDPIYDMGIGIPQVLEKKIEKLFEQGFYYFFMYYSKNNGHYYLEIRHNFLHAVAIIPIVNKVLKGFIKRKKRVSKGASNIGVEWFIILPEYVEAFKKVKRINRFVKNAS